MTKLPAKATIGECVASNPVDEGDAASGSAVDLPLHLTEKILCCISPLESARLATVCKSWAATVSERLARPTPHLFAFQPPRHLARDRRLRGAIFTVPAVGEAEWPSPAIPARFPTRTMVGHEDNMELIGALPSGSLAFTFTFYHSWTRSSRVALVNPVSGAFQCVDTGPPSYDHYSPAIVSAGADAFLVCDDDCIDLWTRAAEGAEGWSKKKFRRPEECSDAIRTAAHCGGVFYALTYTGSVFAIDTRAPRRACVTKLLVPSVFIFGYHRTPVHLLESGGEVVFVVSLSRKGYETSVYGFEVYRLDVEELRWVKVDRLAGDRALFVSRESCFSVRASETLGCRSNCIYFVGHFLGPLCGVYSMEERKVLFQHAVGRPGTYATARWLLASA